VRIFQHWTARQKRFLFYCPPDIDFFYCDSDKICFFMIIFTTTSRSYASVSRNLPLPLSLFRIPPSSMHDPMLLSHCGSEQTPVYFLTLAGISSISFSLSAGSSTFLIPALWAASTFPGCPQPEAPCPAG